MVIGFIMAVLGFLFSNELFYVAIGWESSVVILIILMQEPVYKYLSRVFELNLLEKQSMLAAKIQKEFDNKGNET